MGEVIYANFPQQRTPIGQYLGELVRRPKFWKRVVAPIGAIAAAGALTAAAFEAASEPPAAKECAISTAGYTGPGAADRIVRSAAGEAGVKHVDNLDEARTTVQNQADGLVIDGSQPFNLCFQGSWTVIGDIYPASAGATPSPAR